ncbi:MAG: RepB family plasmid replication initiator protein [Planctomycetes bacterium]|nr:RepB family plasmid replication initiator protein [Planctomycetota bacterium]
MTFTGWGMESRSLKLRETQTAMDMQRLSESDLLRKHIATIHCANSFSLLQRKLVNSLLYHAYHELPTKNEHQITIRNLCQLTGYNSNDYKTIKNALMELISTVIEWNVIEEAKSKITETWNASAVLADARIQGSICTYSYSNRMRELLYMPEIYARLNMKVQARFKSSYGLALYENCIRYQNIKNTPWFKLSIFRKLMGVPEEKYSIFRDFKRRVLDSAIREVNENSNIEIESEIKRVGHKVQAIKFSIQRKKRAFKIELNAEKVQQEKLTDAPKNLNLLLVEKFGFSEHQAESLLSEYSEAYLSEKIRLVEESQTYQAGKIFNLAKYLLSALKENYQSPKSSAELVELKRKKSFEQQMQQKTREQKEEELKQAYSDCVKKRVDTFLSDLNPDQKMELLEKFRENLKERNDVFVLSRLEKRGLVDKIVESLFTNFIKNEHPELLSGMKQFNDFCMDAVV